MKSILKKSTLTLSLLSLIFASVYASNQSSLVGSASKSTINAVSIPVTKFVAFDEATTRTSTKTTNKSTHTTTTSETPEEQ